MHQAHSKGRNFPLFLRIDFSGRETHAHSSACIAVVVSPLLMPLSRYSSMRLLHHTALASLFATNGLSIERSLMLLEQTEQKTHLQRSDHSSSAFFPLLKTD